MSETKIDIEAWIEGRDDYAIHPDKLQEFADELLVAARRLRAEVEKLRASEKRLAAIVAEPKLVDIELEPGGALRMDLEMGLGAKVLAASFADLIGSNPEAKNWVSYEVEVPDAGQGPLVVTVRRKDGKTPEEMVGELRAELAGAMSELERSGVVPDVDEDEDSLSLRIRMICDQEAQARRERDDALVEDRRLRAEAERLREELREARGLPSDPQMSLTEAFDALREASRGRFDEIEDVGQYVRELRGEASPPRPAEGGFGEGGFGGGRFADPDRDEDLRAGIGRP